jgi:pimeloyl-ACP methyl ester carboxylesterase
MVLKVHGGDTFTLIDELSLTNIVVIGTSMGGLMAMIMNAAQSGCFTGVVLNDIGSEVHLDGLRRIISYAGKAGPVENWESAIQQTSEVHSFAFPDYEHSDWERLAHRTYVEDAAGIPKLAYDAEISRPISEDETNAVPADPWPLFDARDGVPLLTIRGELSDILHKDCVSEMLSRKPDMYFF